MSLVALALSVCLQRALVDRTLAEERIYDSMITPIDQKVAAGRLPLIIISIDDDAAEISGLSWIDPDERRLDQVIEIALATGVTVKDGEVTIEMPDTDAVMEAILNVIGRQVQRALMDPDSPWADLWRSFADSFVRIVRRRGAGAESGTRFAAHQIVITCDPLGEPDFGWTPDPDSPWTKLLAALEADPELVEIGRLLRGAITGAALPSWQQVQASMGWGARDARAMGIAPFRDGSDPVTGDAPVQVEATIEDKTSSIERTIWRDTPASFEVAP